MDIIIKKYGFKEGLTTKAGKITSWPYNEPQPSQKEIDLLIEHDFQIQKIRVQTKAAIIAEYDDYKQHNILMSQDPIRIAEMNDTILKIKAEGKAARAKITTVKAVEEMPS